MDQEKLTRDESTSWRDDSESRRRPSSFDQIKELPEPMREIMMRRYGVDTGIPDSLDEIATSLGMTRLRLRQWEKAGLIIMALMAEGHSRDEAVSIYWQSLPD